MAVKKFRGGERREPYRRSRPDEEFAEGLQEVEEESAQLREGIAAFEHARHSCRMGGDLASDYQSIVQHVSHDVLANPRFWRAVIQDFSKHALRPHGIFSALPPDIQEDPAIQTIFFAHSDMYIPIIPRSVLERIDPSLVVHKWLSMDFRDFEEWKVAKTPWKLFTPADKKIFVARVLAQGVFVALEQRRAEFADAIPLAEWNAIVREAYTSNPEKLRDLVKDDLSRARELFQDSEIRDLLHQPHSLSHADDSYRPLFLSLSVPMLRALDFSDADVLDWQKKQKKSINLDAGFEDFEKMTAQDRAWIIHCIKERSVKRHEDFREFVGETLPNMIPKLPPVSVATTLRVLDEYVGSSYELPTKELCNGLLRPTLESQGASAFRVLKTLLERVDAYEDRYAPLINILLPDKASTKIFCNLMSKTGTRFQDFLSFYLDARFLRDDHNVFHTSSDTRSFSQESNLITFVDAKLPWTVEIFRQFEERIAAGQSARLVAKELHREVKQDIDAIAAGDMPEGGDLNLYRLGLLSHVFPPALGVNRDEYGRIVRRRDDRSDDIPWEWDEVQGKQFVFPLGKWELKDGEQFETAPWGRISGIIAHVHDKKIIATEQERPSENTIVMSPSAIVEIGRSMVNILQESTSVMTKEALHSAYALYLFRGGAKLPDVVEGREDAVRVTEWAKDSLRDVVESALRAFYAEDPETYGQMVLRATQKEIPERARRGMVESILGIMKHGTLTEEEKSERVRAIFQRAGVEYHGDVYRDIIAQSGGMDDDGVFMPDEAAKVVRAMISGAQGAIMGSTKLSSIIVQKMLGADAVEMEREMAKWAFIEGAEGGEKRTLTCQITKKKLHSVAGLNMGVCVAVDEQLWNKPEFSNVVLFDDEGIARGGMHFEIIHDNGNTYLSLPGINPSPSALREVSGERLIHSMLEFAKECARAIGAKSVLIPKNPTIFSNREELHRVIGSMDLPTHSLSSSHQFSYSPFAYSWQDAYEVALE